MSSTRHPVKLARGLRTFVHLPLEDVQETDAPVAITLAAPALEFEGKLSRATCIRQTVA